MRELIKNANGRVTAYIDEFQERIESDPVLSALDQHVSYLRDGMPLSDVGRVDS